MSDGDTARETVGPVSHRDPDAWCAEPGHCRPERPNPGVLGRGHYGTERPRPGVSERGHYRPERPNPGVPGRGHHRTKRPRPGVPNGDITGPNGRTLVFRTGTLQAQIPSTASDGLAPSVFDPSLEYSTDNVVLFREPRPLFRSGRLRRLS